MPIGRPTMLTEERQKIIVNALRGGNTWRCAAGLAGVSHEAVTKWKERAREKGDEPYATFLRLTRDAEAYAERRAVQAIVHAGEPMTIDGIDDEAPKKVVPDWKAHAWWLERRRWKDWWLAKPGKGVKRAEDLANHELAGELLNHLLKFVAADPQLGIQAMQKLLAAGVQPSKPSVTEDDGDDER